MTLNSISENANLFGTAETTVTAVFLQETELFLAGDCCWKCLLSFKEE